MAISKKLVRNGEKISFITTKYDDKFNTIRNTKGRKKVDYSNLTDNYLHELCIRKATRLSSKSRNFLDSIFNLNEFNYFLTLHCDKYEYTKIMDKLKKKDKNLLFLSLASWGEKSNLHYHIVINSTLSKEEIEKRCKEFNYVVKDVYNKNKLMGYFRKNMITDLVGILKETKEELKEKQIEILKHKNIISYSKNIKKLEYKKLDNETNITDIIENENAEYLETIEYNKISSSVKIDKLIKNDVFE